MTAVAVAGDSCVIGFPPAIVAAVVVAQREMVEEELARQRRKEAAEALLSQLDVRRAAREDDKDLRMLEGEQMVRPCV